MGTRNNMRETSTGTWDASKVTSVGQWTIFSFLTYANSIGIQLISTSPYSNVEGDSTFLYQILSFFDVKPSCGKFKCEEVCKIRISNQLLLSMGLKKIANMQWWWGVQNEDKDIICLCKIIIWLITGASVNLIDHDWFHANLPELRSGVEKSRLSKDMSSVLGYLM